MKSGVCSKTTIVATCATGVIVLGSSRVASVISFEHSIVHYWCYDSWHWGAFECICYVGASGAAVLYQLYLDDGR